MKNIQLTHKGEDYSTYEYEGENGVVGVAVVTGIAQEIIDTLGKALYKKSFTKKD